MCEVLVNLLVLCVYVLDVEFVGGLFVVFLLDGVMLVVISLGLLLLDVNVVVLLSVVNMYSVLVWGEIELFVCVLVGFKVV